MTHDIVIRGGRLVDGTGNEPFPAGAPLLPSAE
jgi:N-acyl-D-aspartate/D-glutamate deacylase